jgi:type 1 glutamine amidotransferase
MRTAPPLAVITGGHPFSVPEFHAFVHGACGAAFTPIVQHLDDFATSSPEVRRSYAAVLFYFFPQGSPRRGDLADDPGGAIESLLDQGQGCIVLHHALLAYTAWPTWDEVVGCTGRDRFTYHPDTRYEAIIAPGDQPITARLSGWMMTDETYVMPEPAGEPLLLARHPLSTRIIGWSRACRASRVVCLQPGHDDRAWSQPQYRKLLARALRWAAKADPGDPARRRAALPAARL